MKTKLELKDVSFVYSKGTPFEVMALENINLQIEENKITGIIGHTGSGKSTLVQLFNGLAKPSGGTVLLNGEDIWAKPKEIGVVRYKVGLVMQYPEYQLFEETVAKDIAFAPKNMKLGETEIAERVAAAAKFVGLDENDLEKSPFELSGGEKRRAAIAGILAMRPEVLILDEPAAGLDPRGRNEILNGIDEYRKQTGATVVIVSHSMEDMSVFCDNIVVMSDAKIILTGTRDEIFGKEDLLIQAGLDVPPMTKLLRLLRERGVGGDDGRGIYSPSDAANYIAKLLG